MTHRRFATGVVLVVLLILAALPASAVGARPGHTPANGAGYTFTPLAYLGDPAPGGGAFRNDFEPSAINSQGDVAFTADVTTGGEATFRESAGHIKQLARAGNHAPGGGTFDVTEWGRMGLTSAGVSSFTFSLVCNQSCPPEPVYSGVYRFSPSSQTLSAVMKPGDVAPGGGKFETSLFHTGINNRGDIVFSGFLTAPGPTPNFDGSGLFRSGTGGGVAKVVVPGDPAPGGGVFDEALNGWIDDRGNIAFDGHVSGEPCVAYFPGYVCGESVYLRSADGTIRSIAHQNQASPCGGTPYRLGFGPVLNSAGDLIFIGDLTSPPGFLKRTGVFLTSDGTTTAVACPGDSMPGGGKMASSTQSDSDYALNNHGQGAFAAVLNTDSNHDGIADSGIYAFSTCDECDATARLHPPTHVVARTGTVIPGVGTVAEVGLAPPGPPTPPGPAGGVLNDGGQVVVFAILTDGRGVLLVATPTQ